MTDQITQSQVNQTAWAACDTFRGVVDAGQYKDYILVMLFLKYISDLWNDHVEEYRKQFGGDDARIRRRLERERFVLPWSGSKTRTGPSSKASSAISTSTPRPTWGASKTAIAASRTCSKTSPNQPWTFARRASPKTSLASATST